VIRPPVNALVVVYNVAEDAAAALATLRAQELEHALSLAAADQQSGIAPVAYHFESGHLHRAPVPGSSPSPFEGFAEYAVLVCAGERPVLLGGPFAAAVIRALDNEGLFGDLGPIAAGLYSFGVPREAAREYELMVRQGRILVIVQGRARDIVRLGRLLGATTARPVDFERATV
jgi:hypothetical protein